MTSNVMCAMVGLAFAAAAGPVDIWRTRCPRIVRRQRVQHVRTRVCLLSPDEPAAKASARAIAAPIAARVLELQTAWKRPGRLLVGITGGPGSGKSSVAHAVANIVGKDCIVVPMDGFHYSRAVLDTFPNAKEAHARRGAPFTFDVSGFVRMLRELSEGHFVRVSVFDHSKKDPIEGSIINSTMNTIIVEGNYLLLDDGEWRYVSDILEEAWFLDVPIDLAMSRVVSRHMSKLGLSEKEAKARVAGNDRVNALLVEQSKNRAHYIVDHFAKVSSVL